MVIWYHLCGIITPYSLLYTHCFNYNIVTTQTSQIFLSFKFVKYVYVNLSLISHDSYKYIKLNLKQINIMRNKPIKINVKLFR